ncbi:exodeoxyribonuclease VII large subunit [Candidatus Jorgensenbacteria bacterium RIFCSPLOWO2_01_FULL_45_25b]|uniref:Exodeoxyribonuclease 7 large subunit n=1 Tax=Candidatus Jorgensenbacteria bacterium RIFCSPLOWO2_01_FULL_45_25b TaxID=1798471 RepID=A0A1F6BZX9_9BACT|nr:MAG: exodeoxyribonuclease VII large subunit [Candidatus Jorgensenbacteria bacterium RIFCSPLOWO2_01_FULL_45_25b]
MLDILNRLKQKRKELAEEEGKELFMILHNATLEEMAEVLPKTMEELERIKGWGKKKSERYGEEFLEIIRGEKGEIKSEKKEVREAEEGELSVEQFVHLINKTLAGFGQVSVRGEISRVSVRDGNAYFTLKDPKEGQYSVDCFMGRWDMEYYAYLLNEGEEVIVKGIPSLYKTGRFSLIAKKITPIGEGALKKAFEALKKKLAEKGYFEESRKRPIPRFVRKIGLITSMEGEAINDVRKNIGEYGFQIYLFDVRVEGDQAEGGIVRAIRELNTGKQNLDVLVLIRGGGSRESLNVFNSEKIAEAIAGSRIPVLTGIGHERDETIAGYVSDKNLSTPTAVAVYLKRERESLMEEVKEGAESLMERVEYILEEKKNKYEMNWKRVLACFESYLGRKNLILKNLSVRMEHGLAKTFKKFRELEHLLLRRLYMFEKATERKKYELKRKMEKIREGLEKYLDRTSSKLASLGEALASLNPASVLGRGYSIARDKEGKIIKKAEEVEIGEEISLLLGKGSITSLVNSVRKEEQF